MKTIATLFAAAALLAAAGAKKTYTGVVTDSMCGADHAMMKVSPTDKCVRDCVKAGSKYALLAGKDVYVLSDQKAAEKFAAKKVTVTGTVDGKNLTVESITPQK